jgi:hypothetical protein
VAYLLAQQGIVARRMTAISIRSGHRRRGRTVFAVSCLYLRALFPETFPFIHHLHHVTRDAYADVSSQAHAIEYEIARS